LSRSPSFTFRSTGAPSIGALSIGAGWSVFKVLSSGSPPAPRVGESSGGRVASPASSSSSSSSRAGGGGFVTVFQSSIGEDRRSHSPHEIFAHTRRRSPRENRTARSVLRFASEPRELHGNSHPGGDTLVAEFFCFPSNLRKLCLRAYSRQVSTLRRERGPRRPNIRSSSSRLKKRAVGRPWGQ